VVDTLEFRGAVGRLSAEAYRELRREASMRTVAPGDVISEALDARYSE
jgi:hypothetical protein